MEVGLDDIFQAKAADDDCKPVMELLKAQR